MVEPRHARGTPLLVVAAALVGPDGRVCLQQRPLDKRHGGLWEFPGGKVEPGEEPGDALCREIGEELGVAVRSEDLVPAGFAASADLVILLFACRQWNGEVRCLEGEAIAWLASGDIASRAMPPLDYPLAEQLHRLLAEGLI